MRAFIRPTEGIAHYHIPHTTERPPLPAPKVLPNAPLDSCWSLGTNPAHNAEPHVVEMPAKWEGATPATLCLVIANLSYNDLAPRGGLLTNGKRPLSISG